MNCDECKHYYWYYDRCEKWKCKVNAREVHNCFEQRDTPILNIMVNSQNNIQDETNRNNRKII